MTAPRQPYVRLDADEEGTDIWLEPCEGDEAMGLCLGTGATKAKAVADARQALSDAAKQLDRLEREA